MRCTRWVTAVLASALAVAPVVAQVTEPATSANKPAVTESVATPAPSDAPPIQASPVPEPGSILLLAAPAAAGWVAYWRRKWRVVPATPIEDSAK